MRVIGWYHSHPHITVWPSHVGEYQIVIVCDSYTEVVYIIWTARSVIQLYTIFFVCVDVQTQADYQMMDDNFVGLIFAVFNEDKQTKVSFYFGLQAQARG